MGQSNKCPNCGKTIKAHQGNRKTFRELNKKEQANSVTAMTINLRKAIKAVETNQQEKLLQTIRLLVKV